MSHACTNQTTRTWNMGEKQTSLERHRTHQNFSRGTIRRVRPEIHDALHEHDASEAWYKVRHAKMQEASGLLPAANASAEKDWAVYRRNGSHIASHFVCSWGRKERKDRKWKMKTNHVRKVRGNQTFKCVRYHWLMLLSRSGEISIDLSTVLVRRTHSHLAG